MAERVGERLRRRPYKIVIGVVLAVTVVTGATAALGAITNDDSADQPNTYQSSPAAFQSSPAAYQSPSPAPGRTPTDIDPSASAGAEAIPGAPPEPTAEVRQAYIADLDAIDKDIVHGKVDKAVIRGRNQCAKILKSPNDRKQLVDQTNQRFKSPKHPNGFGTVTAGRILNVLHKHLCPLYTMADQ